MWASGEVSVKTKLVCRLILVLAAQLAYAKKKGLHMQKRLHMQKNTIIQDISALSSSDVF